MTTTNQTRTVLHSYTFDNMSRAEWSGHVKSQQNGTGIDILDWFGPSSMETGV